LWDEARRGVPCVGARLISWDGRRLDFDGGGAAFTGHGHPLGHGRAVPHHVDAPRASLFASGAAMLVDRSVFLGVGGFDADYFVYYEDVDLGWRLNLTGHAVVHVPAAVVRHRGGGSAALIPGAERGRRHERNAVATVVKNYGDVALARVLPAALALAACRAGAAPAVIDAARPAPGTWPPLPRSDWPGWPYLAPLELDFDALWGARAAVQRLRRQTDGRVLPLLGQPLVPVPPDRPGWVALRRARDRFELDALIPAPLPHGAHRRRPARLVRRWAGRWLPAGVRAAPSGPGPREPEDL